MLPDRYQNATGAPYRPDESEHRREAAVSRATVHQEMRERFGRLLPFFDRVPDEFVDAEWDLMKRLHLGETLIPNRYKELIGVAVAAASRCRYGSVLHAELARLHGASDAEIEEAVHYTKLVTGWSLLMNGLRVDEGRFEDGVLGAVRFASGERSEPCEGGCSPPMEEGQP